MTELPALDDARIYGPKARQASVSLPEADSRRQYYLNVLELLGASGLALFFLTPVVLSVQWVLLNTARDVFGLGRFSNTVNWLLLLATLAVGVWSAFRVVEWYYER
ncbi:hypothetical protein [Salinirubrum litoreum]|uniref:Uncharacterized protein n=1 Tax=Salinirubrum litoreum TaxID=1126234 RepID=A0ABD5RCD1_9EURY|nr:hypothetical protein [Salinirubrum litoreum]